MKQISREDAYEEEYVSEALWALKGLCALMLLLLLTQSDPG